jgi:hypothetical protein
VKSKCAGHAARIGEIRNSYRILARNTHSENQEGDGKIVRQVMRMGGGWKQSRIMSNGRF